MEAHTTFTALPGDIFLEVLQFIDSPHDLLNACIASREILHAFNTCRAAFIRGTIRRQVERRNLSQRDAVTYVERLKKKVINSVKTNVYDQAATSSTGPLTDQICILEAIQPLILNQFLTKTESDRKAVFEWALSLCRLYRTAGESVMLNKRLSILEQLYPTILTARLQIDLNASEENSGNLVLTRRECNLERSQILLCRELCNDYAAKGLPQMQLEVQRQVLQRLKLMDPDSKEWATDTINVLRSSGRFNDAVAFEIRMYNLCKSRGSLFLVAGLIWARFLVQEYTIAGDVETAIERQAMFLADLEPGLKEHTAWARQLIVMQKRAGRYQDALNTKLAVWRRMSVNDKCYFGWARELADDYRRLNRIDEAKAVIEAMCFETRRQFSARPRDIALKFHLDQAIRSKAIAFGSENSVPCY